MAVPRPSSLCLFCQYRQSVIGRRRLPRPASRQLQTAAASRTADDHVFLDPGAPAKSTAHQDQGLPGDAGVLDLPVNQLALDDRLSFEALTIFREQRQKILRKLSNPWPPTTRIGHHNANFQPKSKSRHQSQPQLPEANAAPVSHSVFRGLVQSERNNDKLLRHYFRAQLLRCQTPREIYRIVAVAMQSNFAAQNLAILYEPIIRALYRSRIIVSDPEVLKTLTVIIQRFQIAALPVHRSFLWLGLRFAARTRKLAYMKRYLRMIHEAGIGISSNVFRSVIAKFSIGHRGLGEIRNGRWRRSDLLQVLKGFADCHHLPPEHQYHLGAFLDRSDWQYLHGWVAVLARCRDADAVWREWELWKTSPARRAPKRLGGWEKSMTTRRRGDYWFLEQMTYSGDLQRAWQIVKQANVNIGTIKERVKMRLLAEPEHCGQHLWETGVREAVVEKLAFELGRIEKAFGVEWQSGDDKGSGTGMHVLVEDQWDVLERLSAEDWKFDDDFGFPYDTADTDAALVTETNERKLHEAAEGELATQSSGGIR